MQRLFQSLSRAALLVSALFLAAAPATAQRLGAGAGSFLSADQQVHVFACSISQWPNGDVHGFALVLEPATQGLVLVNCTSAMQFGNSLGVAGNVVLSLNAPPFLQVGSPTFFFLQDNGSAGPDAFAGLGGVPPQLGNLTIQQIVALIGTPPPSALAPLLTGNIRVW